ncbi:hypothetical protein ILUMI_16840, partial [Ignelater luminosus]
MQIYFGRLAYDMETAMGILPRGVCPIPKGNYHALILNFDLENNIGRKTWQHLVKVEDDFCRALQIYMGRFAYDMETALGILPRGVCPIPKGNYHAVNYTADFSLMRLQALPFGRLRLIGKYLEKSSKDIICCITQIAAYFVLEDSYPCNDVPNRKVNFTIIPKTFSRPQVIDLTVVTPIPLGNQLKFIMNIDLENNIGVKTWQRLVQLEDDFCRAMQLYVGTFLYEVETAMGIQPRGVCPIPK